MWGNVHSISCFRYEMTEDTDADALVANLATSSTSVVVIFALSDDVTRLMRAREGAPGTSASDLVFIATKRWRIEAGTSANDKSIAFDLNTPNLQAFDEFLASQEPLNQALNPWFDEYYQTLYQCNLSKKLFSCILGNLVIGFFAPCGVDSQDTAVNKIRDEWTFQKSSKSSKILCFFSQTRTSVTSVRA